MELHLSFLRLQGQANDFKIQYSSVVRLFLLPKVLFLVSMCVCACFFFNMLMNCLCTLANYLINGLVKVVLIKAIRSCV